MTFGPSEELGLLCDVCQCDAALSMISGVDRSEHDWGRLSVYLPYEGVRDYDLCQEHYNAVTDVLEGRK